MKGNSSPSISSTQEQDSASCSSLILPKKSPNSSPPHFVVSRSIVRPQPSSPHRSSHDTSQKPGTDKPVPVDFETFWHTPMKDRVFERMIGCGETAELLRQFLMTRDEDWAFELFHSKRVYKCLSQYFDGGSCA